MVKSMGFRSAIVAGCLVLTVAVVSFSKDENRSTVLPESAAQLLAHPCSRSGPPRFEGTWRPTHADVQVMESRLSQISRLRSEGGLAGVQIKKPAGYYRQYVGLIIGKRRLIYINAFCEKTPPPYWRERPVDVCDGGCNWGALYDTLSGSFSRLQVNGIA